MLPKPGLSAPPRPKLRTALLAMIVLLVPACDDPAAPPPAATLQAASATAQDAPVGSTVADAPAVRVLKTDGTPLSDATVIFTVESGGGSLTGASARTDADGVARAGSWTLGDDPGINSVTARLARSSTEPVRFTANGCALEYVLDHALGDYVRLKGASGCPVPQLIFDPANAAGHEYLVLLENMPLTGAFDGGLFPGAASGGAFSWTMSGTPAGGQSVAATRIDAHTAHVQDDAHVWDFGAGRIRELVPQLPPEAATPPRLLRDGRALDLNSVLAEPQAGDTIEVRMEAIARLGIATGNQKAIVRLVTPHLIIAEDVRLGTTLVREGGTFNTPLSDADLAALASEYAANAMVQGDLLFEGRHNTATEDVAPNRVIAVHSLMPSDDVWGYTYSSTNYFVWDYWVATDGSTKGLNQLPQRVADNLFMHEIAHMRHWGLLQRAGSPPRGNRWLVEGFARFTERLPVAARLLGTTEPSRTANLVLPRNPAFNNAYFLDDVPTYGSASAGMFFGYQTSSYVFDYFADQVALQGGSWRQAVRELLRAAGAQNTLDAAVSSWLPGVTFADLFTRARIALYADDIGTSGLPAWTQYHQYRLRESRALPQAQQHNDPRVAWPRLPTATSTSLTGNLPAGAAIGFVIDGTTAPAAARFTIQAPAAPNATLTLVRVR